MKLVTQPRGTSFYESFSDLIFGTLVLFIVLVMGLVLKMQETVKEASERPTPEREQIEREVAQEMIAKNRFIGGTDWTWVYWCAVRRGGTEWIAFVPVEVEALWNVNRSERFHPVRLLCEHLVEGSLFMLPANRVSDLGVAFGEIEKQTMVVNAWYMGYSLEQAMRARERLGRGATAQQIADAIGGLYTAPGGWDEYKRWLRLGTPEERMGKRYLELESASRSNGLQHTRLQFSVPDGEQKIRLGRLTVSGGELGGLLRSIKPGRGFFVEYMVPGGDEEAPPGWVMDEVLTPTGFDGRALSSKAERLLGNE